MNRLQILQRYLQYQITSKDKYRIHSPFVFKLLTEVIRNNQHYDDYDDIERLKNDVLKQKSMVEYTDFGARSGNNNYTTRLIPIGKIVKTSAILKKNGRLLYRLILSRQPKTILELGTSTGFSTMYMARANPEAQIYTIEGCASVAEKARSNFQNIGISNVELSIGNFNHVLPKILKRIDKLDFLLIDGNKRMKPTLNYFEQCLSKAGNDSVFVIDDIHWSDEMENAWEYIRKDPRVTVTVDLFSTGLVFFRKESEKQNFSIRF
jgi:predicted O-methyltransferase YrrM